MVTIHGTELKEGILQGISKARELGRPILVSEISRIESLEPLSFFANGKESFLGERFYWKSPGEEFCLAGLGIAAQLGSDKTDTRFLHINKQWEMLVHDSIVIGSSSSEGVGPLMFGGFTFDPHKEKTALWSKYQDALFHIPRFMITVLKNNEVYFTTNIMCTRHDGVSLFNKVASEREALLTIAMERMKSKNAPLVDMEEIDPTNWKKTVETVANDLKNGGPLKKVVLARELRLRFNRPIDTGTILENLQKQQKSSYIFSFESGGDSFIGGSPERLVKKAGPKVLSACLAGSIPRGKTEEEDKKLGSLLLSDEKNLSEHQYVVDMIREALEETCEIVAIPEKPQLMKVRDIQHLYTPAEGIAKKGTSLLQLVERLHPTPALGGLPKKLAVEKIREVEVLDRGLYAAPVGWMDYFGNGEFAVAIRSGLIQGKEASLFAGCGIVANSDVESEYLETGLKFRPMLSALGGMKE
ncbi:isochorismate synthase [Bacillus sp. FJAT-27225]|uniref:isochorismate synthase n=1 Tax=Bacillus sp. FJAT-27225 TaxID=1743144 RepID=UPI00080C2F4F|nr:isochorismate synthase [Bacillus sp. FJAT-27225]OCA91473.1 isochorismate synthase [Bacillus sp. FJAT-27225]